MALLEGASPRVAVNCLTTLQDIFLIPTGECVEQGEAAPKVDKRLGASLLKNPGVMNPLVKFLLTNVSESPRTDMEWAGIMALSVLDMLCVSDGNRHFRRFQPMLAWEPGRYDLGKYDLGLRVLPQTLNPINPK